METFLAILNSLHNEATATTLGSLFARLSLKENEMKPNGTNLNGKTDCSTQDVTNKTMTNQTNNKNNNDLSSAKNTNNKS